LVSSVFKCLVLASSAKGSVICTKEDGTVYVSHGHTYGNDNDSKQRVASFLTSLSENQVTLADYGYHPV